MSLDGQKMGSVLLLDWNESAFGPPPAAMAQVLAALGEMHRYPRELLDSVTAATARSYRVGPEEVLLTAGVDEAVELVLTMAKVARYITPGFRGYADRATVLGVPAHSIPLDERWQPDIRHIDNATHAALFLAQPHNPTGNFFEDNLVLEMSQLAELVIIDTTYRDFAANPPEIPAIPSSKLLRFHSFSKAYGLAGMRIGALIGAPPVIATLRQRQRFYSVGALALHALAGALSDTEYLAAHRAHVLAQRPRYVEALRACPAFDLVRDTHTNFVLARCAPGSTSVAITDRLAARGVRVHDCAPIGMPGWLRITVGTGPDLRALTAALHAIAPAQARMG